MEVVKQITNYLRIQIFIIIFFKFYFPSVKVNFKPISDYLNIQITPQLPNYRTRRQTGCTHHLDPPMLSHLQQPINNPDPSERRQK